MEDFITPPEAPVFQPTAEEFRDPIAYLTKIRPVVVNTGICKIRPPSGWKPPFSLDVEKFSFTPRLQPLNELEAKTRVKLNFLEHLAKFWELQGVSFKIPNVDRSPMDLHTIFKAVTGFGGFKEMTKQRKWTQLAREMGYDGVGVAGSIRQNYEKYLYPYEIFLAKHGNLTLQLSDPSPSPQKASAPVTPALPLVAAGSSSAQQPQHLGGNSCKYGLRQNKRRPSTKEDPDYCIEIEADHPEFRKLAFTSPGPKNAFAPLQRSGYGRQHQVGGGGERREEATEAATTTAAETTEIKQEQPVSTADDAPAAAPSSLPPPSVQVTTASSTATSSVSTLTVSSEGIRTEEVSMLQHDLKPLRVEEVKCEECGSGDYDEELLLCDGCDASFHAFCLDPPLPSIPPGDWRCPTCVAQACTQDSEAFGFEQSKKSYSLQSFGEKANQFKSFYFRMQPTDVPYSMVEKEFWRLVSSIEDDVTVEYGADLHTSLHGSGFPTPRRHSVAEAGEEDYLNSGWNLNNIPNLKGSILRYISADISGMKVPWLYIGMCFSCFCWHIEDHWSYSINYLHWGEPKTWYGVPPAYAECLEATMKEQAPELFESHPDLMHHLATILSPAVLMKHGIPVVRTDQCEGEFVVTFPRAYHAGFNQGFNCAEAVNFLLGDWLPVGRQSIEHYRSLTRTPVFSHDELLCKMVAQPEKLELCLLPTASEDTEKMAGLEEKLRQELKQRGIVQEQREVFELASDEDRLCSVCSTYCFLSAVRCPCSPKKLACGYHGSDMCDCPPSKKVLRYRYTIKELYGMLKGIQVRSESYRNWCDQVEKVLDGVGNDKTDLDHLRDLLEEGTNKSFSLCPAYDELRDTIKDVEESASVAVQLTRRGRGEGEGGRRVSGGMDVESLREFLRQVETLPCRVPEAKLLEEHLREVEAFQREAQKELHQVTKQAEQQQTRPTNHLSHLLSKGEDLGIEVPESEQLRVAVQQSKWVMETEAKLKLEVMTMESLKRLLKQAAAMQQSRVVEVVSGKVRDLLSTAQDWENEAKAALRQRPPHPASYLEELLVKVRNISVQLPSQSLLAGTLDRAAKWRKQAQLLQDNDSHPHYDALKRLLASGRPIAVKLDLLAQLESRHAAAKGWVDRAARTFIKKNSTSSLLEVLLPRTKSVFFQRFNHKSGSAKKKMETGGGELDVGKSPLSELGGDRLKEMEKIHAMEADEMKFARQLRNENLEKMERDECKKNSAYPQVVYCFCRKPESGYMLQCELCNEWYHATCLHIPKGKRTGGRDIGKDSRFLCALCLRTRRPRLDAIVSLLISLQKVPVAISEGTALHCLAERAISWQKRARQEISNCTTVLEAAKQQMRRVEEVKAHISKWSAEMHLTVEERQGPTSVEAQLASSAGSVLAHYDSELQRLRSEYAGLSGSKREALEHLLMEGDLLEVTMDEVQQLWQLLQLDTEYLSAFDTSPAKVGRTAPPKEPAAPQEEKQLRRRKRSVASPSPSVSSDGSVTPTGKRRRTSGVMRSSSVKRETTPVSKSTVTIAHNLPRSAMPAAKKRPPTAVKRSGSSASHDDLGCNEEIAMEEEEDEGECSATQCLQPVADQIIWVQCDHCQEWFHCICVGLTKEYAEQIETYKCASCKQATIAVPATSTDGGVSSPSRPLYSVKVGSLLSSLPPLPSGQT